MSIAAVQTVQSTKMHVSSKPAQVNKIKGFYFLSTITQYFIRRTPLWTMLATCDYGDHQQIRMWSGFPLNKSLRQLICLPDQDKTLRLSSCVKIVMTGLRIEGPWSNTLGIHIRPEMNMHLGSRQKKNTVDFEDIVLIRETTYPPSLIRTQ